MQGEFHAGAATAGLHHTTKTSQIQNFLWKTFKRQRNKGFQTAKKAESLESLSRIRKTELRPPAAVAEPVAGTGGIEFAFAVQAAAGFGRFRFGSRQGMLDDRLALPLGRPPGAGYLSGDRVKQRVVLLTRNQPDRIRNFRVDCSGAGTAPAGTGGSRHYSAATPPPHARL